MNSSSTSTPTNRTTNTTTTTSTSAASTSSPTSPNPTSTKRNSSQVIPTSISTPSRPSKTNSLTSRASLPANTNSSTIRKPTIANGRSSLSHSTSITSPLSSNSSSNSISNPTSQWVKDQSQPKSSHSKYGYDNSIASERNLKSKTNGKERQKELQDDVDNENDNQISLEWSKEDLDLDRVGYLELNQDIWKEDAIREGNGKDERKIIWLDIDNTLYRKSTKIAELMSQKISQFFLSMGMSQEETTKLHHKYYKEYGLAIRGLVRHHDIDPLEFDEKCDASLPLDEILKPDLEIRKWLEGVDRSKCRVLALTNAFKVHAQRVLSLLDLTDLIESLIYCNYERSDFHCKPEPEFYLCAMIKVGLNLVEGNRCYFVDDSAINIKAAKKLGWESCVLFQEEEETLVEKDSNPQIIDVQQNSINKSTTESSISILSNGFSEENLKKDLVSLNSSQRLRLFSLLLDSTQHNGEILNMSRVFERCLKSIKDLVSGLPDEISFRIFERLDIKDLLRCRLVSKKWQQQSLHSDLWKSHALALTESDPVPVIPPSNPEEWEELVKGLFFRERNWSLGLAQKVDFFNGHSNFVTSLKLRGRNTLVSGSYDETIRVWDIPTGQCKKVLGAKEGAKAVSCLDLLDEQGILVAGLYDSGRCLVWDMKHWELVSTLQGHNRGIRNVAINEKYLVSVGQDKAIVVWDWRTGLKLTRFGQQSNVSLGVSIIDTDKIVAVTVDGIIRTFSISEKRMIGEYNIPKLTGDKDLIQQLNLGGIMMQWFEARKNFITIASKDRVIHLEWIEELRFVDEEREREIGSESRASSVLSRNGSSRNGVQASSTPIRQRIRKLSTQSNVGTSSGIVPRNSSSNSISSGVGDNSFNSSFSSNSSSTSSNLISKRRDSNASVSSNITARTSGVRSPTLVRSPTSPSSIPRTRTISTSSRSGTNHSTSKSSSAAVSPPPWPMPGNQSLDSPLPPLSPSLPSPSMNTFNFPTSSINDFSTSTKDRKTRLAPNLKVAPRIISIQKTPDMAVGCTYPSKKRVISSTRFSTRSGSDKLLYSSTFVERKEKKRPQEKVTKKTFKLILMKMEAPFRFQELGNYFLMNFKFLLEIQ